MVTFIGMIILGIVFITIGIFNRKGNISMLHSYHRERVKEEDKLPFGKLVGLGMIIIGCTISVCSGFYVAALFTGNQLLTNIGTATMFVGLAVGIVLAFYAMKKYNGGIF